MPAFYLDRVFECFEAVFAGQRRTVDFNGFQQFLPILFLGHIWVVNPLPALPLLLFEILFQFPASLDIGSIMKIEATVAKGTVA